MIDFNFVSPTKIFFGRGKGDDFFTHFYDPEYNDIIYSEEEKPYRYKTRCRGDPRVKSTLSSNWFSH